ncbi:MAG TPA: hypothetical protein VLN91_08375 [Nitrospirota bacterium]|nr:hypothetical protein [Nitrospirota bacterium]
MSNMGTVQEGTDESLFWMELLVEAWLMSEERLKELQAEAKEILANVVSSIKTAKRSGS